MLKGTINFLLTFVIINIQLGFQYFINYIPYFNCSYIKFYYLMPLNICLGDWSKLSDMFHLTQNPHQRGRVQSQDTGSSLQPVSSQENVFITRSHFCNRTIIIIIINWLRSSIVLDSPCGIILSMWIEVPGCGGY